MANLETLLQDKSEQYTDCPVLGVYDDFTVLFYLHKLCRDKHLSFSPFLSISSAKFTLDNEKKRFGHGVITLDISLAEKDGYNFIEYLKAEFPDLDVYVTYVNSNDAKMKASLENARKHIGGKVSIVPWKHSSGIVDPAEGASTSTVLPKTQSVPSSETIPFSILKNSEYNDPAEGASVSTEPPKIQAGPSSSETVVDLSVLKNPEYNDPEGASVSTELQMGLPEDSNNSAKRRRTQ